MRTNQAEMLVIAGAGGHAKVVAEITTAMGLTLAGATDAAPRSQAARASGLPILGTDSELPKLFARGITSAAVGIGTVKDTRPRDALFAKLKRLGFRLPPLIHPSAIVAVSARLGEGCQVMPGCIVNPDARLGPNAVVNTGALVEHDCIIGRSAFLAPGVCLGGGVHIGAGAFIGMGAIILQTVRIGPYAVVGAGAVVLKDVPAGRTALGLPAKIHQPL